MRTLIVTIAVLVALSARGATFTKNGPSTFAARYIQGGTNAFNTTYKIWREGITGPNATCATYTSNNGSGMKVVDLVRFDERERDDCHWWADRSVAASTVLRRAARDVGRFVGERNVSTDGHVGRRRRLDLHEPEQ